MGVRLISYNINGLHSPVKKKKIIRQLKQLGCDIAYLQESHLSDAEHEKLGRTWADKVYFSSHSSGKRRGVAVLINRRLNFTHISHYADTKGRYILVNGIIGGMQIYIYIYAPNEDDPAFMTKVFGLILDKSVGVLIAGGDMNCVMSQYKDKTPRSTSKSSANMSKILNHHCEEMGLLEIWRYKHPKGKDFTFYSHRHSSYSRIDLLFTPRAEVHRIKECKILPITISDHSPVLIDWCLGKKKYTKTWRLNTSFLNDPGFTEFVKSEIYSYLELNDKEDTSPLILWDCAKAFLRGRIISFCTAKKKERELICKQLEGEIESLEKQHKTTQSSDILNSLLEKRKTLDSILSDKAEGCLRFTRQRFYEHGARASRLLAFQLRKDQSSRIVTKVKTNNNPPDIVTDPEQISKAFANFYKTLYTSTDVSTCEDDIKMFLDQINVTQLPDNARKELDKPISPLELEEVIKDLKNNKSPGPDGYVNEFYKKFKDLVSPLT